jgi:flagellar basal body-associated protein FliL
VSSKKKEGRMTIIIAVLVIVGMIAACYFTSGLSNNAGTIFERKSAVTKVAKK